MNLTRLLREKRIVICCGSGGVGKTTTSAALGLRAAALRLDAETMRAVYGWDPDLEGL